MTTTDDHYQLGLTELPAQFLYWRRQWLADPGSVQACPNDQGGWEVVLRIDGTYFSESDAQAMARGFQQEIQGLAEQMASPTGGRATRTCTSTAATTASAGTRSCAARARGRTSHDHHHHHHRFPWGDGPAPALDCAECGRRLGKKRAHFLTASNHLLCADCLMPRHDTRYAQRRLHAKYYPHCPVGTHDMWDHQVRSATRAGAWYVLTETKVLT